MLNLHRSATERRRNYTTPDETDFGSVVSTGMVFTTRFGTTGLKTATVATAPGAGVVDHTTVTAVHPPPCPPLPHEFVHEFDVPQPEEEFELGTIQEVHKDARV